ncbi:MAG: hypothetical protein JXA64_01095 [Candidatus Fermentibacteraceae bacterium]|nr:hypothetical protein [Candidatus Fermentibacteraceae bacterium]MBN2607682.1 hypothetical protein [Candidatus Fermentibacteraceae bacterium]
MKYLFLLLLVVTAVQAIPEGVDPEPNGTHLFPCAMTRYSDPIKISGVLGVSFNRMTGYRSYRAFFVQVEPGIGGGKLNLGYRLGEIQFLPIWNLGLSASALQTWGNPLGDVEPEQTYLGLELSGAFAVLGLNFGIFKHAAGDDDDHDWIYTMGVGVGI